MKKRKWTRWKLEARKEKKFFFPLPFLTMVWDREAVEIFAGWLIWMWMIKRS
ncbi:MAG: hypothetical protein ACYDHW_06615 [Syntrophorhabdaceae bacterium]